MGYQMALVRRVVDMGDAVLFLMLRIFVIVVIKNHALFHVFSQFVIFVGSPLSRRLFPGIDWLSGWLLLCIIMLMGSNGFIVIQGIFLVVVTKKRAEK
jgi:hypothetical protein